MASVVYTLSGWVSIKALIFYFYLRYDGNEATLSSAGTQDGKIRQQAKCAKISAENEVIRAELRNLRGTLAPHLIYNMINAEYAQVEPVSRQSEVILGLVSLFTFAMNNSYFLCKSLIFNSIV